MYRWTCINVRLLRLNLVAAPLASSEFLGGLVCIVGTLNKYCEQNVVNSSTIYHFAIDPSGAALLRNLTFVSTREPSFETSIN
jgi:hypothetical protein